jgi:hypothetical protein
MRIYVAGPYSADNVIDVLNNIQKGMSLCAQILKNGDAPFCPWLDYQFHFFEPTLTVEDYYRYSMAWLEVSEEVWVLSTYRGSESKGTKAEIERATELGIPVRYL